MTLVQDLGSLRQFKYDRLLGEDPITHSIALLGTFPEQQANERRLPAIIRIERAPLVSRSAEAYPVLSLDRVQLVGNNDVYTWLLGWLGPDRDNDVKINIIYPATEVHIRKYTAQERIIVRETPELYQRIVKPYIDTFAASRTQWVEDILLGKSETDKVLYNDPSPISGFLITPDMKWDLKTLSSLYLLAIVRSREIRSLRDLRKGHVSMLRNIHREASRLVKEKWDLGHGSLRFFIHYQPSYYHFHVHIASTKQEGLMGMTVGQAHLLDDVISMLEVDHDDVPLFERMTLTYILGDQHGLFESMRAAQDELSDR